jgi:uncharacterized protein (TIGR02569 family)
MFMTPPDDVLRAFGITEQPQPLSGGEGTSFLAGTLVLKPISTEAETIWRSELMTQLKQDRFRVALPQKTLTGEWSYQGWEASTFIEGQPSTGRVMEKIAVSRQFHRQLLHVPKPSFIEAATHPWAVADRMVWGEKPLKFGERLNNVMGQLNELQRPVALPEQLIHGDMTGNILFHESLDPAVIDFSPYWRPAEYATAIILVDSIVWDGADVRLLLEIENTSVMNQLLVRAAMWRVKTTEEYVQQFGKGSLNDVDAYQPFIELLKKRF